MIIGEGKINLPDESLNLAFNTIPRKGVGISADMFITPFVSLTGQLNKPRIGLNKKGVVLSGTAAVMTGGISLLAKGMFDRATIPEENCSKLKAELDQAIQTQQN